MKIQRTETDMRFRFKLVGKYQDLISFINLTFYNKLFSTNTAGLANKPDENGDYWISFSVNKWDDRKAHKIIEDCTGVTLENFELIY